MDPTTVNTNNLTDEELIAAILANGDMELFGELYDRYGNKVYRKAISMVKDVETSKDLTQEILIKAFLSLSKFEGKAKFSTWLYMITYNYCIDYLRKQKRILEQEQDISYIGELEDEKDDGKHEKEILEIEIDRLDYLLEQIPTLDKSMLLMYYQDDMSIKDLQDHFELGASAIKMRLSRARLKLKTLYETTYN
ncbi:MAG: RNA polymerase sigma factor [Bacteroidetes bacterium]|nr:RNA polymerase sigma factor [Bacteroidota bacterium]